VCVFFTHVVLHLDTLKAPKEDVILVEVAAIPPEMTNTVMEN
jgi:hypothetical protein